MPQSPHPLTEVGKATWSELNDVVVLAFASMATSYLWLIAGRKFINDWSSKVNMNLAVSRGEQSLIVLEEGRYSTATPLPHHYHRHCPCTTLLSSPQTITNSLPNQPPPLVDIDHLPNGS